MIFPPLGLRRVVQIRVTSISDRVVAGSSPARQIDLPVAQLVEHVRAFIVSSPSS